MRKISFFFFFYLPKKIIYFALIIVFTHTVGQQLNNQIQVRTLNDTGVWTFPEIFVCCWKFFVKLKNIYNDEQPYKFKKSFIKKKLKFAHFSSG